LFLNELPFLNSTIQIKAYKLVLKSVKVKTLELNYRLNRRPIWSFVTVFLLIEYRNKRLIK